MKSTLVSNPSTPQQPYTIQIDASLDLWGPRNQLAIPVFQRDNQYYASICGFSASDNNIKQLSKLVLALVSKIINIARVPTYVFIAQEAKRVFPIYTLGDDVIATTPGGPSFRHVELAKVRRHLSDYLHASGEIGENNPETLHVRGVHQDTLQLVRPIFYLKKRVANETEFWAPVFPSLTTASIYTYAANERREQPITTGMEVLNLTYIVASGLMANERLSERYDLRPDRLLPEWWDRLESRMEKLPEHLIINHVADSNIPDTLALYKAPHMLFALDPRAHETRPSLYLGNSLADVKTRVAKDYLRKGLVTSAEAVSIN